TAEEAYRRTIEVINRAIDFVNARTAATPRFDGLLDMDGDIDRDVLLREVLPALRGAVSSERHKVLVVDTSPRVMELVPSAAAPGELQGQVALVTGAAAGIGRAVGDALAAAGACVVAFDLDEQGAVEAVAEFGDRGAAIGGDVTSEEAVAAAFDAAVLTFGG